jgi:hypothetical protein
MTPDTVNAIFEGSGALLQWGSTYRIYKDRGYAGIYLPAAALFTLWGYWNLFYYPYLGQMFSFWATIIMVSGNTAWLVLMMFFGRKT